MNLHDIVPLSSKPKTQFDRKELEQTLALASDIASSKRVRSKWAGYDEKNELETVTKRMESALTDQIHSIGFKFGRVPQELLETQDQSLRLFYQSPVTSADSVRRLADSFGFVIIPWAYVPDSAFGRDDVSKRKAYRFGESSKKHIFYTVCPVSYYCPSRHVAAEKDLPIYPGPFQQAFMAIQMSIPLFRQLARRVDDIDRRQAKAEIRLDTVEKELANLRARIEEMHVAEERRQIALLNVQREIAIKMSFIPLDPLMLAIPSDKSILGDCQAIIGPCWGPEFEDLVSTSRGYKKINGQRAKLKKLGLG